MNIRRFTDLGCRIARRIEQAANIDDELVRVAVDELAALPAQAELSLDDLLDLMLAHDAPRQIDSPFSDLPIIVFRHRDFYIELLVWLTSTTTIHQHSFAGAFLVYRGGSLHTTYRYTDATRVDNDLMTGRLVLNDSELLAAGDVRAIRPGADGLIHSLYHLQSPSITLVVRTPGHIEHGAQYGYFPPGIALNDLGLAKDDQIRCLRKAIAVAEQLQPGSGLGVAACRATTMSAGRWVYFLMGLLDRYPASKVQELLAAVEADHLAPMSDLLRRAVERESAVRRIVKARRTVSDPELRFFLALLMNVPSRERILQLIRERHPTHDPLDRCADWMIMLAQQKDDLRVRMMHAAAAVDGEGRLLGSHIGSAIAAAGLDDVTLRRLLAIAIGGDRASVDDRCGTRAGEVLAGLRNRLQAVPELHALSS